MSEEFAEWLKREMPAGTVISDPEWWAARILKAARTAPAEPVAWVDVPSGDQQAGCYPGYKFEGLRHLDPGKHHLYTAPDALQTEGTTSDKYRAELYDEVWQKARDMGYGNVTDALAEVERLKHFEAAYKEWSDKTEWARSIVETKDLGKHLADIVRENFERLREEVERLKIAAKYSEEVDATPENQRETILYDTLIERDELKADAERFKYVLSQIPANLGEVFCQCLTATDDDIIEAIDAARTAKPEVDHE